MKIVLKNTLVYYHLTCKWTSGLLDESLSVMPLELREFLCEWYAILYEKEKEDVLGFMDLHINQHARLQIGAEMFGSTILGRHEKNATILAKWNANNDESTDIYPGKVQYYFEHTLRLPDGPKTHLLAYVKWYKNAPSSDIRFKRFLIAVHKNSKKRKYLSITPLNRRFNL